MDGVVGVVSVLSLEFPGCSAGDEGQGGVLS